MKPKTITRAMIDQHKSSVLSQSCTSMSLRSSTLNNAPSNGRKDPHEEFFKMTLLAFKLNHPASSCLQDSSATQLYKEVQKIELPFFKWPQWIE
jgi:hypothetical protein